MAHKRRYVIYEVEWMADAVIDARKVLHDAEHKYHEAMYRAVRAFTERGVPYRDQAEMLGVTHRRISAIVGDLGL